MYHMKQYHLSTRIKVISCITVNHYDWRSKVRFRMSPFFQEKWKGVWGGGGGGRGAAGECEERKAKKNQIYF